MSMTKRLDALEAAVSQQEPGNRIRFILLRIISPETKDEPMRFATHASRVWERGSDESDDDFDKRVTTDIDAEYGIGRVHRVMFSADRRDCG